MDNLNLNKHISGQFNAELEHIRTQVLTMGGLVEQQLTDAITAMHNQDGELAKRVIEGDAKVNMMEVAIDEACVRIIAKRQPTASDLRLVMAIIKTIHGELTLGRTGEIVVELAASWTIIMIVTGLYLWWPRQAKGIAGILWPRLNAGSRIFWRDLHAVTGIYVSGFALILLLTALPWTSVWGAGFKAVVAATKPATAKAEWSRNRAEEKKEARAEAHAGHDHHMPASAGGLGSDMGTDLTGVDKLIPAVQALDLPKPVVIKPDGDRLWQAGSATQNLTARRTVTFDANTGAVVKQTGFADKAPMDKVVLTAISLHEGHLFGWLNQLVGLLTALGLLTLSVSAVVMWWTKRPSDRLGAPPKREESPRPGLLALIVGLSIFLPVMGASLILVALIERLILRRIPSVRDWLGLT